VALGRSQAGASCAVWDGPIVGLAGVGLPRRMYRSRKQPDDVQAETIGTQWKGVEGGHIVTHRWCMSGVCRPGKDMGGIGASQNSLWPSCSTRDSGVWPASRISSTTDPTAAAGPGAGSIRTWGWPEDNASSGCCARGLKARRAATSTASAVHGQQQPGHQRRR